MLVQSKQTSSLDVHGLRVALAPFLGLFDVLQGSIVVAMLEIAPSQVLVYSEVLVVVSKSCLVRLKGSQVIILLLIQQPNLQQRVNLPFGRERRRQD